MTEHCHPERRVTEVAKRYGLVVVTPFDLTNGWDFNRQDHQDLAWAKIKKESPYLLIGSPPCTHFSMLQVSKRQYMDISQSGCPNSRWRRRRRLATSHSVVDCIVTRLLMAGTSYMNTHGPQCLGACLAFEICWDTRLRIMCKVTCGASG